MRLEELRFDLSAFSMIVSGGISTRQFAPYDERSFSFFK